MVLPEPAEVREHADEAMAAAAVVRPGADVFDALSRVFARDLSDTGLIDALVTIDRLKAHLDARQAQLLTELAKRDPDGGEFLQDEVACHDLPDDVTSNVQERVLQRVQVQTPGEFAASVRRAIATFDTRNQAERHRAAVSKRHVSMEHVDDGMSWINLFLPRDGAEIVWTAIAARAVKTDPADERTADQQWGSPRQ